MPSFIRKMRHILPIALLVAGLSGCQGTLDGIANADAPLPDKLVAEMEAKDMREDSPVLVRIFKEENQLEVWKQNSAGRYAFVKSYEICTYSGKLGPKFVEGDRQAPEGFYTVRPHMMNPNSSYHLSFNLGYPNEFDRAHGRTGQHLMVHGDCSSSGCYAMTDEGVSEIYAMARDAFKGGQRDFQVQAFPFKMTDANLARYAGDPNMDFWLQLKQGYDAFESTGVPPAVGVCNGRYVFNQTDATGSTICAPQTGQSAPLAYQSPNSVKKLASTIVSLGSGRGMPPAPKPTIAGIDEANLVADWSRRRARGEQVAAVPPSLPATAGRVVPAQSVTVSAPAVDPLATSATQAPAAMPLPEPSAERFGN